MAESADKTSSAKATLDEESDVIELTEEVGATSPVEPDDADDLDSMGLEMPTFKVPGKKKNNKRPEAEVPPDSAASFADDQPTTQRLSQKALEQATSHDTGAELKDDSESTEQKEASPKSDYDRQSMVKTIQMDAFDRDAIENLAQLGKDSCPERLADARFSPEIIASPPKVLVKKWREGLPGGVELILGEEKVEKSVPLAPRKDFEASENSEGIPEASVVDGASAREPTLAAEPDVVPDIPDEPVQGAARSVAAGKSSSGDNAARIEIDPGLAAESEGDPVDFDDEVLELDEDLLELEVDEELEETSAGSPPEKPAPPVEPTKKKVEKKEGKPDTREPEALDGDPEMKGLVEELMEDEKVKSKKTARVRPRDIWFKEVFCEEFLRTVPANISAITDDEADFIEASLKLKKKSRILDLACGFGRHSIELAGRGYEMVGLDLSTPLLQRALDAAKQRSIDVKFIRGDMRELNFSGIFDGCFIWDTSLGYFDDRTNLRVLQGVHRSLKTGGRLLIDVVNRDYVVRQTPTRLWWEGNGCIFLEESEFDYQTSTLQAQRSYIYEDGSPPLEHKSFVRLYNIHELRQMLHVAGFKVLEVSGARYHRGHFLGASSQRIIILAERRKRKRSSKSGKRVPDSKKS